MQQRSQDWFDARLGRATASRFNDIMATTYGGKPTAGWKNYRAEIVSERLTGKPYDTYTSPAMQWGTDNEPLARLHFELKTKLIVEECGFFEHETLAAGASPDGLIGESEILEIKCPNTATHIETLRTGQLPNQYKAQVQGQMWITGRQKAYFVSFDPRLPENARSIVIEVPRDNEYIATLQEKITQFLKEVDAEVEFVRGYGSAKE